MPSEKNEHSSIKKASDRESSESISEKMASLVRPGTGHVGFKEVLPVALGLEGARLVELRSVPLGILGQRLMALRYLVENGEVWFKYFAWEKPLARLHADAPGQARSLWDKILAVKKSLKDEAHFSKKIAALKLGKLAATVEKEIDQKGGLEILAGLSAFPAVRTALRARLEKEGPALLSKEARSVDLVYLLSQDLTRFPATTVGECALKYVIVADKGEMGARAVREALELGLRPIALYNQQDDKNSLSVRLAEQAGGYSIPLAGGFRETYANPVQIAERVEGAFRERFGDAWEEELSQAALYPGYGPLAENTQAIEVFRRSGIVFIGPMQDVVERAGDKRKFRLLAQGIDPNCVTPGIVMNESDPAKISAAIKKGAEERRFKFPGRIKAANGGGGRGQVVIGTLEEVPAAVSKVLGEIKANGWDQGVMFEQNIFETIHLEVQIVRDRFGNTRHFGMRDCSEQRASQKIQEEAPPALLKNKPELSSRMCEIARRIADEVGYVGAATVELMYKGGHFYLLEMNTRIQVEHPVTEEAHRIRRGDELLPLNLVALQYRVAQGLAIDFAQEDIVQTHVAREFRINAESYKPNVKDPRDGKMGLFLPNAGVFDEIVVPDAADVHDALESVGTQGIEELFVRFDCGFEVGDDLVNKDPTFGKLIVSVLATPAAYDQRFELLRLASIEVLRRVKINGRQLLPNGKILEDRPLETNVLDHIRVLSTDMLKQHSQSEAPARHVNWLIEMLRRESAPA